MGAGQLRRVAMVLEVLPATFTRPTSASVPVFTDQRSTPHWARRSTGNALMKTARRLARNRGRMLDPPFVVDLIQSGELVLIFGSYLDFGC